MSVPLEIPDWLIPADDPPPDTRDPDAAYKALEGNPDVYHLTDPPIGFDSRVGSTGRSCPKRAEPSPRAAWIC